MDVAGTERRRGYVQIYSTKQPSCRTETARGIDSLLMHKLAPERRGRLKSQPLASERGVVRWGEFICQDHPSIRQLQRHGAEETGKQGWRFNAILEALPN